MFTGIVRAIGQVVQLRGEDGARRLTVDAGRLALPGAHIGDSIALSGVCLTIVALSGSRFDVELSRETLARTRLGRLEAGSKVNLEPAVTATEALGGHLVTGHVDGVAIVRQVVEGSGTLAATLEAPPELARYVASQGSVTLDGVSLTVTRVAGVAFGVELVPHTRAVTTLGSLAAGQALNLEVDLIARYLERLLEARGGG
ncbi:MAG: riboflavin synthase [Steroidobacteraceae bacterium]